MYVDEHFELYLPILPKIFFFSLNLDCPPESMEGGVEPAVLTFTPTRDMPDTLYYQSFTTKHLGGVIRILDRCDDDPHRGHRRDRNRGGLGFLALAACIFFN